MAWVNRRVSVVAALAALGMIGGGGRETKADATLNISKGGIVVVGGSGNGTDPAYTYQFELDLQGTITPGNFFNPSSYTSFTVDDLVGVYPLLNFTGTQPTGWIYTIFPVSLPTRSYPYFISDVTWTYVGQQTISSTGPGPLDVGLFQITTQSNLPAGYTVTPSTVNYTTEVDGGPSTPGANAVTLEVGGILAVPEPSTLIAPIVVVLSLPVVKLLRSRRGRGRG